MEPFQTFPVGARVRIRRSAVPGLPLPHDHGVVVRSDARGLVVRLDSGHETICEPNMLTLVAPPPRDAGR
ncbi:hypothetical protein BH11MYX4_BH11MYX4_36530 [soil metagenome]